MLKSPPISPDDLIKLLNALDVQDLAEQKSKINWDDPVYKQQTQYDFQSARKKSVLLRDDLRRRVKFYSSDGD